MADFRVENKYVNIRPPQSEPTRGGPEHRYLGFWEHFIDLMLNSLEQRVSGVHLLGVRGNLCPFHETQYLLVVLVVEGVCILNRT